MNRVATVILLAFALISIDVSALRVKDMASISGVRSNQLLGYGLVVGLDGTGDQTQQTYFTAQSLKNMLTQLGIVIPPGVDVQVKNIAAVMVQADLPPFAKPGQTLDVTVSSVGNSKSLRGGALIMTPLKGADGQVYAIAQGNLIIGGFGASGANGSSVVVNTVSAGRIPNGATVERRVSSPFTQSDTIEFNLHSPDFTTARRLADRINRFLGSRFAKATDNVSVTVDMPLDLEERIAFVSELENLEVEPAKKSARVIINARTGTVVIGSDVQVLPAAVAHGNLTVSVAESTDVSQPSPFSETGETQSVQDSEVTIIQEDNPMFLLDPGVSLQELVEAINSVGAPPGDLVSILQALEEVGALRAQLIVI